ncbi:hypothetical protein Droror1_Dr00008324, partial [Drosera rotundifolia]
LVSLQLYDQYFLASSMDGSIKLYDNRQIQHGAVQSYEGHVNSHTRIQLAIDQYERFVASGGEDGKVRTWSIKSGELLLEDKISNGSIPTACWDSGECVHSFTECQERFSMKEKVTTTKNLGVPILDNRAKMNGKVEKFWPVVGWINHQYVPLQLRVIFHSLVAFGWGINVFLESASKVYDINQSLRQQRTSVALSSSLHGFVNELQQFHYVFLAPNVAVLL